MRRTSLKLCCLTLLCLCCLASAQAQLRHVKGIKAIDAVGGITGHGYFGSLGFTKYTSAKVYYSLPLQFEKGSFNDSLDYQAYSFDPNINYTLVSKDWFYLAAKGGLSIAYTQLSQKAFDEFSYALDSRNFMSYGGFIGAETECFLADKVSILLSFRQYRLFKTDLAGKGSYYIGFGIRYSLL